MRTTIERRGLVVLALALALAAPRGAAAGPGRVKGKVAVERSAVGLSIRDQHTVSKGVRGRLTGGLLGRQLGLTTEQRAGSVTTQVKIGRDRATTTVSADGAGTRSSAQYTRRGLLRSRTMRSRVDQVSESGVRETGRQHRFFGGSAKSETVRETGPTGNTRVSRARLDRAGAVRSTRLAQSGDRSRPGAGKVKGQRRIDREADGLVVVDTQTKRWGLVSKLTLGRFGKQATATTEQRKDGVRVSVATRRKSVTLDSTVSPGETRSTGTVARKGRVQTRETSRVNDARAERVTEDLRRGGTVKRTVGRELTADTGRTVTTGVRRDGTARSVTIKQSSLDAGGEKSWKRSVALKTRSGKTILSLDLGRSGGKTGLHLGVGSKTIGTKAHIAEDGRGQLRAE